MIIVFAIVIAIAVAFGYAGRAAKGNYQMRKANAEVRRGLVRGAIDSGHASRSQSLGIRAGSLLGTSVGGWSLILAAFAEGIRVGYPRGAKRGEKAKAWVRDRFRGTAEISVPVSVSDSDRDRVDSFGRCTRVIVEGRLCGRRRLPDSQWCEQHQAVSVPETSSVPDPVPSRVDSSGGNVVTGEVMTAEQLRLAHKRMIADAQAELEDAVSDHKRAQALAQAVEQMINNMVASKIDVVAVAKARDLLDVCGLDVVAAAKVVASKETVVNATQASLAAFESSSQTVFHSN